MSHSFESCWAKVDRADEQIINLNREVEAFLNEPPYGAKRVVYAVDDEARKSAGQFFAGRKVPVRFAVLVGEILHNLRSALDHVANQLVIEADNTPTGGTAFPIFTEDPTAKKKATAKYAGRVKGMSLRAQAIVQQLQPYYRSRDSPHEDSLAILAALCNRDKHRELNLAVMVIHVSSRTLFFSAIPEHGAELGGSFATRDLSVNMGDKMTPQIQLADPSVTLIPSPPLIDLLQDLSEAVREVITIFSVQVPEPRGQ